MATLRQRLNRKNAAGGYDAVYLETSSDLVLRPDGTTVEFALANVKTEVNNIVQAGVAPTSHAAEHATGGKDPITPVSIGAAAVEHSHTGFAASDHTHNYAGAGTPGGAATTAVKLQTKRTLKVNLASTTAVEFDGSSNVTPGVSGILPAANGGTGRTDGAAVKLATGRTVRVNLASTTAPTFDGTGNITPGVTGILPVANGGTGASSLPDFKEDLGLTTGGIELDLSPGPGSLVKWGGYYWIVVHKHSGVLYLALDHIYEMCRFGSNNTYMGSNLAARCTAFANTIPAATLNKAQNTTVNGVTAKIFVCSYEQANGGFDYFAVQGQRICKDANGAAQVWWTSSPSSSNVYYVNTDGGIDDGNYGPTNTYGFRPFVAVSAG